MYAVVITVTFEDRSAAAAELEGLVSQVNGMPGFRAGYWVALSEDKGTSMIVFDSEDSARALAAMAENAPAAAVTTESIEVGEVLANA
jgi:heme-degrading monooxygenase HmoA